MKIPNLRKRQPLQRLSLARIVSEDSQQSLEAWYIRDKSSKDS